MIYLLRKCAGLGFKRIKLLFPMPDLTSFMFLVFSITVRVLLSFPQGQHGDIIKICMKRHKRNTKWHSNIS